MRIATFVWLAVGVSCAAASARAEALLPVVTLNADESSIQLEIANPHSTPILIVDERYGDPRDRPPYSLQIRVADPSGAIYAHCCGAGAREGWWNPAIIESGLRFKDEPFRLEPSKSLRFQTSPERLLWGMKPDRTIGSGICRYQVRAEIDLYDERKFAARDQTVTATTEWIGTACKSLFPGRQSRVQD